MEVFSTVVVEISTTVCAFLPRDDNSAHLSLHENHPANSATHGCLECFGHKCSEIGDNYKAKFLEEKMKELSVSVVVTSERLSDSATSLKLCGGWTEICAARTWLLQFIETPNSMQNMCKTQQLDAGGKRESSGMPRRSSRIRHSTKQHHNADKVLLSTITKSSRQRKRKPLKENNTRMNRRKVHSINMVQNRNGDCNADEGMFYHDITKTGANVNASLTPVMVLTDEHMNSVMKNNGALCIPTGVMSGSCSELIHLKEPNDTEECEQKLVSQALKCDSCEYVTRKRRNLLMHTARAHGDRSYICPTCNRTFAIAKDLKQHLKCHSKQRFCCEHCGRMLKSKYTAALHVARIHKGMAPQPAKRYLCNICGKICRNRTDYNTHRNREHTGMRPFQCDLCNASFFAQSNLSAHHQVPLLYC